MGVYCAVCRDACLDWQTDLTGIICDSTTADIRRRTNKHKRGNGPEMRPAPRSLDDEECETLGSQNP
jgi:hypothetical protein